MTRGRLPIVLASCAVAAVLAGFILYRLTEPTIGRAAKSTLQSPDRIEVMRLADIPYDVDWTTQNPVSRFDLSSRQDAATLLSILRDRSTFDERFKKRCSFSPGINFRIHKGATYQDFLICFSCGEIRFGKARSQLRANRQALVQFVQRLFPGDELIQAVKP